MSDLVLDPWLILGTEPTADAGAIRKAYARRLKQIDPETDAAAFIELRHARDWAIAEAIAGAEPFGTEANTPAIRPADASEAAEPGPASPVADQLDHAAVAALQAMVLDPASTATPADIDAQTERVLSDPALANIDQTGWMEEFISRLIVQGTPISDAMLDPAIRHFRWDADRPDLDRLPIVGWVAQRQADIGFENGLAYRSRIYAELLRGLRRPELPPRPRWTAWRFGIRAEYLLTYLQQLHPTVLAGAD